jgi:hypothetical protein
VIRGKVIRRNLFSQKRTQRHKKHIVDVQEIFEKYYNLLQSHFMSIRPDQLPISIPFTPKK